MHAREDLARGTTGKCYVPRASNHDRLYSLTASETVGRVYCVPWEVWSVCVQGVQWTRCGRYARDFTFRVTMRSRVHSPTSLAPAHRVPRSQYVLVPQPSARSLASLALRPLRFASRIEGGGAPADAWVARPTRFSVHRAG